MRLRDIAGFSIITDISDSNVRPVYALQRLGFPHVVSPHHISV